MERPFPQGTSTKVRHEVMEQLFGVNKPNITLSVQVNGFLPCIMPAKTKGFVYEMGKGKVNALHCNTPHTQPHANSKQKAQDKYYIISLLCFSHAEFYSKNK